MNSKQTGIMTLLILGTLFLFATTPTQAISEHKVVIDEQDDVVDLNMTETLSIYPNIDIVGIDYTREGIHVTETLTVKGFIQDLGSQNEGEFSDSILYYITLETSEDQYDVIYMNKTCVLSSLQNEVGSNITDYSIQESTLVIHFDLNSANETYSRISVETGYIKITSILTEDFGYFTDSASDQPIQVIGEIPEVGNTGENLQFKAFPQYGQPSYTFQWTFGDETTSTDKNPTHSYTKAGVYNCTVTVTDQSGDSESYTGEITIVKEGGGTEKGNSLLLFVGIIVIMIVIGAVIIVWIIRR
jgi:hypothetical protein